MTKRQTKQRKNKLNDEKRKLVYDRNDDGNATKELDATQ